MTLLRFIVPAIVLLCLNLHHGQASVNDETDSVSVFVVKHGWHTSLIIERETLGRYFPRLTNRFPHSEMLDISWGDKKYFMAPDHSIWLAVRAVLVPTQSVVRVVGYSEKMVESFEPPEIEKLMFSGEEFRQLAVFLQKSFSENDDGELLIAGKRGIFFFSQTKYWGFRTCNSWIAKALKNGGYPIKPLFSLTSNAVMRKVK
jgi:hypothetical protein